MSQPDILQQGLRLHQQGQLQQARECYQELLASDESHVDAWNLLGAVELQTGNTDEAQSAFERAVKLAPEFAGAHCNLGSVYLRRGELDKAIECFEHALEHDAEHEDALYNIANCYAAQGRSLDAIQRYEAVLRQNPGHLAGLFNLANACLDSKQHKRAIECYTQLLSLDPDNMSAWHNLGNAQRANGDLDDAIDSFKKVIMAGDAPPETLANLGAVYAQKKDYEQAERSYEAVLALWPDFADVYDKLGKLRIGRFDLNAAVQMYKEAVRLAPDNSYYHSNLVLTLNYLPDIGHKAGYDEVIRWAAKQPRELPMTDGIDLKVDRVLKIGYLSPDFNSHPVGYFTEGVIAAHHRTHCEIYCYNNGGAEDEVTHVIRGAADHWCEIAALSDMEAHQQIRKDGIDILIDLSGHTGNHRLSLFALRPAPIQAHWIGYFGTTGLKSMDYVLVDDFVFDREQEPLFAERPKYLLGNYLCFTPPKHHVDVVPAPYKKNGFFTFGCFSDMIKINADVLSLWLKVLQQCEGAKVLLKSGQFDDLKVRERVIDFFTQSGVAAERLIVEGSSTRAEYLATYGRVDLMLDTFPFAGGTTTAEALWMGVPVLSLKGERWCGRISGSILRSAGLERFVVNSVEEYLSLATEFYANPAPLAQLRDGMRERVRASNLCDADRFATNMEQAYREMWLEYCKQQG